MVTVIDLASEIHDELLKLVAPATPGSIEASSLAPGRNGVMFSIAVCATVSLAFFIAPIFGSVFFKDLFIKDLRDLMQIIGGAGLGSSFYALYTASNYIKSSTFEPKYGNTYLIRFVLGVLSGIILAYFLKDFLSLNTDAARNGPGLANIGVSALALVGGYAAEAVVRILDRVSDTLVALVSGSDKDKIEAARQKAETEAQKKAAKTLNDTVKNLHDAVDAQDIATIQENVKKVARDILDRK